jgi:hypothetical protein
MGRDFDALEAVQREAARQVASHCVEQGKLLLKVGSFKLCGTRKLLLKQVSISSHTMEYRKLPLKALALISCMDLTHS